MTTSYVETRNYKIFRPDGFVLLRLIGIGYDIFAPGGTICAFAETEEEVEEKIAQEKREWLLCKFNSS